MISASQTTFDFEPTAPLFTCSRPRYELRPPSLEMDFDVITEDVLGATCVILPPASWCWFLPAKAIDSTSPCAPSPFRITAGYFIVICDPRLPSTHSMVAFRSATARLVTRL